MENIALNEQLYAMITAGDEKPESLEAIRTIIQNGANVNARCNAGYSFLSVAVESGNEKIVNILLSNGANPNTENVDNHWNAFHMVCNTASNVITPNILTALFVHPSIQKDASPEINVQTDEGCTPLHFLAYRLQDEEISYGRAGLMVLPFMLWQANTTLQAWNDKSPEDSFELKGSIVQARQAIRTIAQHYDFFITDEHHVQSIDYIKCQQWFKLTLMLWGTDRILQDQEIMSMTDIINQAIATIDAIAKRYNFFITDEHHVQSIDYIKCQEWLFKLTPAQRAEQYFFSHTRVETLPVELVNTVRYFLSPEAPRISQHAFPRLKSKEQEVKTTLSLGSR